MEDKEGGSGATGGRIEENSPDSKVNPNEKSLDPIKKRSNLKRLCFIVR